MRFRAPAAVYLRRAQVILILVAITPTVLATPAGVLLLAQSDEPVGLVSGILVLAFCTSSITGYILASFFVSRGASLSKVQNHFLSAVSHELRTPLTSMRMFVETLRENRVTDPEERERCLEILDKEMKRLDGLVNRLIELSRIESGAHGFRREHVELDDVVREALGAFDAVRLDQPVDLEVEVEPGLAVRGDRAALVQAVANLLVNAWKYTDPKDRRITVAAGRGAKKGEVEITVSDNGPGIAAADRDRIFEMFERGDRGSGTGLGLAVVRAIVRAHRGKLDLRTEPGRGSTFRIRLKGAKEVS